MPLFTGERKRDNISSALDKINEKYGMNSIYYGSMHGALESAPMRIAFSTVPDVMAEGNRGKRNPRGIGRG